MELLEWMFKALWASIAAPILSNHGNHHGCGNLKPAGDVETADGIGYKLLMNTLGWPRHMVFDSEDNLLVLDKGHEGVRRIVLDGGDGLDVCVESESRLITGSGHNHGLAVSADGKTIFASTQEVVLAYPYDATQGTIVGEPKTIVEGMLAGGHATRTLFIPGYNPNLLLVSWGSRENVDADTVKVESGRSQIRIFDIDALMAADEPVDYFQGRVMGWGLRNSVGIAEDPVTGYLWSVENSVDNLQRFGQDIHNSNPGEEMNFHGSPNQTDDGDSNGDDSHSYFGKNYGYPGCFAIWDHSNVDDYPGGAATGQQMMGIERGGVSMNVTDDYCRDDVVPPRITFGSHLAPLDITFRRDGAAAFVSMHGSWNRQPPNGYRVSRVDFADGEPLEPSDSKSAEVPLMWNKDNNKCPKGCFRPVGLAVDKKGRLFMTSDSTGELYVITGV